MKKLFASLIVSASVAGVYFAWDDINALVNPEVDAVAQPETPVSEEELDEQEAEAPAESQVIQSLSKPTEPTPVPTLQAPRPQKTVKTSDAKLMIREIKFDGVTAFSAEELQGVVSEFIGQELTLDQAVAMPAKISNYYQAHNLVARATLVGSLASGGVVKIGVIETKVKQSQLDNDLRAMTAVASEPVPQKPSQELSTVVSAPETKTQTAASNVAKLEVREDTSVVARFEQMSPTIALPEVKQAPQSLDEETDFILKRYAKKSRQYELLVDNYGYEATGSRRVGVGLVWDDALSTGDKLSLQGLKSQGSHYLQAAYEWATGIEGLKLGARVSDLSFDVVNGLQTAATLSGDALKKGVYVAYDLVSAPSESSSIGLRYDTKKINTTAANFADSAYYDTKVMGIEFKGFEREMAPGGAVFTYDATLSKGDVNMNGSPNQAADLAGEQTYGAFSKLRFAGSVLQPLGDTNSVFFGLTIQRANKNLDASEKMYLGGPLGVRAYGVGEGVGSDGELMALEFRQRLGLKTTLSEFYDVGHIRAWHNGNAPGAPANNAAILRGYGFSLTQKFDSGITLKGTWAQRAGQDPDTAVMPRGHDGHYDRNRFWLSLESRF